MSQVPLIDGWHRGRNLRQRLNGDVAARTLAFIVAAVRDMLNARRGRPPYLVPVIAKGGKVAVFTEPEASTAFEALGGESVGWRNELAPRFFFALPRYRKGTAERLTMPVLMCLGDHDLQASSRYAARIASGMPNVQIRRYPVGHFDVYLDPLFDEISTTQADFLREHLCTPRLPWHQLLISGLRLDAKVGSLPRPVTQAASQRTLSFRLGRGVSQSEASRGRLALASMVGLVTRAAFRCYSKLSWLLHMGRVHRWRVPTRRRRTPTPTCPHPAVG